MEHPKLCLQLSLWQMAEEGERSIVSKVVGELGAKAGLATEGLLEYKVWHSCSYGSTDTSPEDSVGLETTAGLCQPCCSGTTTSLSVRCSSCCLSNSWSVTASWVPGSWSVGVTAPEVIVSGWYKESDRAGCCVSEIHWNIIDQLEIPGKSLKIMSKEK